MEKEPSEFERFNAAARELATDDGESGSRERVGKLVKHKPVEKGA